MCEKKHVFIINPVSGPVNASKKLVPLLQKAMRQQGMKAMFEYTKAPRHATELVQHYASSGNAVRFYAVGGDGTLNEVMAGAYHFANAEVASVPCGSGNDFVRTFGTADDFLNFSQLIAGHAIDIDLLQTDLGVCVAITSTGLDAEVAHGIPKYRRIPLLGGQMAYTVSVAECLLRPLGKQLRITVDGETLNGDYAIAAVCNGKTYGGGFCAAPMADVQDGYFDMILVKKISRLRVAKIINSYKKGEHIQNGAVVPEFSDIMQHRKAKEVRIVPSGKQNFVLNIDGECTVAPCLYAKVLPKAARFVLPLPLWEQWQKG